jgi:tRNA (uracil-5-)-methyltransferase
MQCNYFGKCGSCTLYDRSYEQQLEYKVSQIKDEFNLNSLDILTSKDSHFRDRAEFRIYHDDTGISYAMNKMDKKGVIKIDSCSIVNDTIAQIMPKLLIAILPTPILKQRLFSLEFLSSKSKKLLVTLIYHKKVDDAWVETAKKLANDLNIDIIGRSRKVKRIVTKEFITESLEIVDKNYNFRLYDTGFTQPNSGVNEKMIGWVKQKLEKSDKDLLELYCGHGNFTLPISSQFRKVLATEISKRSIKTAKENCELNDITNISFVRLSSEELTQALNKVREFRRLEGIDLDSFDFDTVFVDPPRSGLDEESLKFISNFKKIIYISCNPKTLKRDLEYLKQKFEVSDFAVFDQFAYTEHLECGVILNKNLAL